MTATEKTTELAGLRSRAGTHGYSLHPSITDETMQLPSLDGGVEPIGASKHATVLDVPRATLVEWSGSGYMVSRLAGVVADVGQIVRGLPTADEDMMLVCIPQWRVVALASGVACDTYSGQYRGSRTYMVLAAT